MYIYIYYESQPLNIYICVYYKVRGLGTYTGEKPPFLHFNPRQLLRGSESVALSPVKRRQLTRHDLRHVEGDVSHWHHGHVVLQMIVDFLQFLYRHMYPYTPTPECDNMAGWTSLFDGH